MGTTITTLLFLTLVAVDDPGGLADDRLGPVPAVVARVGEIDLTKGDLAKQIRKLVPQVSFHQTIPKERARTLRNEALESLILAELKWQQAVREGRVISDAEVRAEVDRAITTLAKGERERWAGRELTLVAQHGPAIRRRLSLEKIEQELVPAEVLVTDERIEAELAAHPELAQLPPQVRLRHLLVKVEPGSDQSEYERLSLKAANLRDRIVAGESFGEVARAESDDVFKERGGETDWLTQQQIIYKPVGRAAFALEPEKLSAVIESLHGFHLIEVIERRQNRTLEATEARALVRSGLRETIREEKRQAWHKALFEGTKVERFYDPLRESGEGNSGEGKNGEGENAKPAAPTSRPRG